MFQQQYALLASVQIEHPYYLDGRSPDFSFEPVGATESLLAAARIRAVQSEGTIQFLQQKDPASGDPFLPLEEPIDLFYRIRPTTNILSLTSLFGNNRYFFSNLRQDGTLNPQLTQGAAHSALDVLSDQKPLRFRESIPAGTYNRYEWKQQQANLGLITVEANDIPVGRNYVDLGGPAGVYQLVFQLTAGGIETQTLILTGESRIPESGWGLLHLHFPANAAQLPVGSRTFRIPLAARSESWRFVLVERNRSGDGSAGTILPQLHYDGPVPANRYPNSIDFVVVDINTLPEAERTLVRAQDGSQVAAIFVFDSTSPLSLFEEAPPQVVLTVGSRIIDLQLPIPSRVDTRRTIYYTI